MRHKPTYSRAEHRTLLPDKGSHVSGFKDRLEVPMGWLEEIKLALRIWELRQEHPHLRAVDKRRRN